MLALALVMPSAPCAVIVVPSLMVKAGAQGVGVVDIQLPGVQGDGAAEAVRRRERQGVGAQLINPRRVGRVIDEITLRGGRSPTNAAGSMFTPESPFAHNASTSAELK